MPNPENPPDGPRPWYHVGPVLNIAADDSDGEESTSADVYLFNVIGGWWGLTADDFVRDVAGLDVDQINLHLNTPGRGGVRGGGDREHAAPAPGVRPRLG